MRELEQQTRRNPNHESKNQTTKEHKQEDPNTFKEAEGGQLARILAILVFLRRLKQHDGDCIVQDGFSEDDSIQFRIDFVGIEDGEDGDRVGGAEGCADGHGFDEVYAYAV